MPFVNGGEKGASSIGIGDTEGEEDGRRLNLETQPRLEAEV